jgi:hypothetical protein
MTLGERCLERTAKPLFVGSIPTAAFNHFNTYGYVTVQLKQGCAQNCAHFFNVRLLVKCLQCADGILSEFAILRGASAFRLPGRNNQRARERKSFPVEFCR